MRAYLIGNGCSVPYGSPLGGELMRRGAEILFSNIRTGSSSNIKNRLMVSLDAVVRMLDFFHAEFAPIFGTRPGLDAAFQQAVGGNLVCFRILVAELAKVRIWEALPIIDDVYGLPGKRGFMFPEHKRKAIGGKGGYYDQVAKYTMEVIKASLHGSPLLTYDRLVRYLVEVESSPVVVNLNYDSLLEEAAEALCGSGGAYVCTCGPFIPTYGPRSQSSRPWLRIVKPHGAFHGFYCDTCDAVSFVRPGMCPLFLSGHQTYARCQNPRHANAPVMDPWCLPYAPLASFAPVVSSALAWRAVWGARALMRDVDEVIVIGCGFPPLRSGRFVDQHIVDAISTKRVLIVSHTHEKAREVSATLRRQGVRAYADPADGVDSWLHTRGY